MKSVLNYTEEPLWRKGLGGGIRRKLMFSFSSLDVVPFSNCGVYGNFNIRRNFDVKSTGNW